MLFLSQLIFILKSLSRNLIYWTDVGRRAIVRSHINQSYAENVILSTGLEIPGRNCPFHKHDFMVIS